jgi:2-methylcitrate dehydratase PrpD
VITLTAGVTTITLPADMVWEDEHDWHPVEQQVDYTLTGAILVHTATKAAGRPITLVGEEDHSWVRRATVDALKALADITPDPITRDGIYQLTLRGVTRDVVFRHHDGEPMRSEIILYKGKEPDPLDWYQIKLKFMEV